MRSPPADLVPQRLGRALAEGWGLHAASIEHVPEGGGSYHWKLIGRDGQLHFVTVDDLDDKDWLGDTRGAVFGGLGRALGTAAALRYEEGLEFVVAPVAARDGELLRRLDDRYSICVFPFLGGRSYRFGPYTDARLRARALDTIAALHRATPAVRGRAPHHVPRFAGRGDLDAFLLDPGRRWKGGPFSEAARHLLVTRTADLARLATGFDRLAEATAPARADPVITHGEPHPANFMSVNGRLVLIDWDTAALAPPERDVSLISTTGGQGIDRYQRATGRELDPAVITLYRLRWYLDDLASAIRLFRHRHRDTPDTRRWWHALAPELKQLPHWLDLLA
ncbi:MAG TPA: phosphotransferase [Streptosporangiaceae bacterium]|nr:phosphotransferase [Streptosporangiaceae bacterium]